MDIYLISFIFFIVLFLVSSWRLAKDFARANSAVRNYFIDREIEKENKEEERAQLLEDYLKKHI